MTPRICSVPGCDSGQHAVAHGLCPPHYKRVLRTGRSGSAHIGRQLNPTFIGKGEASPTWTGNAASYYAAHRRVATQRGPAREYYCAFCYGVAVDWSYDYGDPKERTASIRGRATRYSLDPQYYRPMCRSCHAANDAVFDGQAYALGAELTEEEAEELRPEGYGT